MTQTPHAIDAGFTRIDEQRRPLMEFLSDVRAVHSLRQYPVGEHHRGATLTFAEIPAWAQGLAEGEPALASEAMLDDGHHRVSKLIPE